MPDPEVIEQTEQTSEVVEEQPKPETVTETVTEETEEQKKHKGGFQRRIDRLTRDVHSYKEALEEERLARQRLEARLAGQSAGETKPTAGDDPEPTIDNWKGTYEELVKAQAKWAARQEFHALTKKQQEQAESEAHNAELKEVFDTHQERLNAARDEYEDFDEVTAPLGRSVVPEPVGLAIMELDNGPAVLYHLGKNPEKLRKLNELSELSALTELGKIAASLSEEDAPSPTPKPVTQAPDPIKPIKKSSPTATGLSDDLDIDEWMKRRREQLRRR